MTQTPNSAILSRVTDLDLVPADSTDSGPPPPPEPAAAAEAQASAEPAADAGDPAGTEAAEAAADAPAAEGDPADGDDAADTRLGPGEELDDEALLQGTAALLYASPEPLSLARLVDLLQRPARARVRAALAALEERLVAAPLPLTLTEVAGGWRILTRPEYGEVVQRLAKVRKAEKVTPAALETLSIVAYRQPVTKAEVEAIRGVQSGAMLRSLVDQGLVRVTGRADQPGSPLQYGTSREFLNRFGLASLKDLPRDGELAKD